jgi:succinyl-diaminopimelate desuccinylase
MHNLATFDPTDPVLLAQALVRCPSVTPEEGGALALLAGIFAMHGFEVHRPVFSAEGTPSVENLYAARGEARPRFVFAGHTDVVPPGDAGLWREPPFSGTISDGKLYGRGAVDMKGGVAASIAASLRFVARNPDFAGSIAFLLTGDEEGPAINGTVKLLDWAAEHGYRFDHCLLGEPTNPEHLGTTIKYGRRGSLTGHIRVHGTQGHVAYPHLADNPADGIVRLLASLKAAPLDMGTPHFDASNLEITTIDIANPASNVIPAEASASFNIRFNDLWTPQTLEAEIRARLAAAAGNKVRYTASFNPTNSIAFLTEPGEFTDLVSGVVAEVTGRQPDLSTTGGTSDARFIKNYCPVLEFGLVGQTMHMVDEHAAVDDIIGLTAIYERVLERYFAA